MKKVMGFLLVLIVFLSFVSAAGAIVSDDFSAQALNTSLWTFINPLGDATLSMTGTQASISIPAGTGHDVWTTGNFAPRIMQPASNTDFEIEVKFESSLIGQYQMNGIIIEQDSHNFLRYDFYSSSSDTMIFAAVITTAAGTTKKNISIGGVPGAVPLFMRVKRAGDQWTQSYSFDGKTWTGSVTFSHVLSVTAVGAFAGNAGSNPAYTALIDYFFDTASPIVPEDGPDTTPPVIDVWYGNNQVFGQIGIPQLFADILGNVSDRSGIASLTYSLNNGPQKPLSMGPNGNRLQTKGDFNAEIAFADLSCGNNALVINAVDDFGNSVSKDVNVQYSCGHYWPEAYSIDWSMVTNIQDVAQIVDGLWKVESDHVRPVIQGYDRLIAVGDIDASWDDYEITAPITIHSLDSTVPYGSFVGFLVRWQGHYDWDSSQPMWGWWPMGGLGGYDWVPSGAGGDFKLHILGNNGSTIAIDNSGRHLTAGVPYIFKMRVETTGATSTYSLKVWEQNSPEPAGWDISGQGPVGELKYGSVMLCSHYTDADFGNVTVTTGVNTYTISATAGANGTISPSGAVVVNSGTNRTFTVTPSSGYHIADVKVDGTSVGAVSEYTFSNVLANHTISASFTVNTYTISATAGANGTISPSGAVVVNSGTNRTFTVTPSSGYHIADVKVDGTSVGAVSEYTFSNVLANHTISASFTVNTYTISATAGANGTISPSGAVVVNSGTNRTFTVTPSSGYHIADVKVDGTSVGAVSEYTFSNVLANHTISASFTVNTYTISATAGANGTISPSGAVVVNSGTNRTFTVTPSSGYHIADVKVDGTSVGAVSEYTFSNVLANHTISASFTVNTYTISATAGANGTISPSGAVVVNSGTNRTFTVTPSSGYHIADVKVDGTSVGAVSTYTFNSVTNNHTIEALFETVSLPDMNVSASSLDFGKVIVGSTANMKITVVNTGKADLIVSGVELSGKDSASFTSNFTGTKTLMPSTSIVVDVTFIPSALGNDKAVLKIKSNVSDTPLLSIPLSGIGSKEKKLK